MSRFIGNLHLCDIPAPQPYLISLAQVGSIVLISMRPTTYLHTGLWQRLPRRLRRKLLFITTSRLAPRPSWDGTVGGPVVVAGFLRTASGLGESARLCHDALIRGGYDVYGIDLSGAFKQPGPTVNFSFRDGRCIWGAGTVILHINSPFVPLALLCLGRRLLAYKKIVGYWAWELQEVPAEWRVGIPFVHEIWVPSRFTAEAIGPIAGNVPVEIVPHPVAVNYPVVAPEHAERRPFTVLLSFNMASGFSRKNPLGSIAAFKLAFGEDLASLLVIRLMNSQTYKKGYSEMLRFIGSADNIKTLSSPAKTVSDLYAEADAVLSLHRSEGFGLVIAEAMLRGLPVVATDWSGNVDFLTPKNGFPISYSLIPAVDDQGTYDQSSSVWAEPNISEAAAALRQLRYNRSLRTRIGAQAAADAANKFSVATYRQLTRRKLGGKLDG